MKLGAFSISLAVKDLERSKQFYEKLGFTQFVGDQSHNWLIMKNGPHIVGLFQGMFKNNMLTFNPGWDQDAKHIKNFDDVRALLNHCQSSGMQIVQEDVEGDRGPGNFTVVDPDGNLILIDQHV